MKCGYIKYSDERNKNFSIKTVCSTENNVNTVKKFPIYEEGIAHLDKMYAAQEKLKKYYTDVYICKAWKDKEALEFEFITGKMLLDKYKKAVKNNDIAEYEKILRYHKKLICGNEQNKCNFTESPEFNEWFGDGAAYNGKEGLKFSNFDAIASNIIMRGEEPVFIDYEWTIDFVIPKDLAIYHCINDGYIHNMDFEEFYPMSKVFELLNITTDKNVLSNSYNHFFEYVISDKDGHSYAKDKYQCIKLSHSISTIMEEWQKCADEWKKAAEANNNLTKELATANIEWEKCANEWKNAVVANKEMNRLLFEALSRAENAENAINSEYLPMKQEYEYVANTKVWKVVRKTKKLLKRK